MLIPIYENEEQKELMLSSFKEGLKVQLKDELIKSEIIE
jgi:hypothetical protein